MIITPAAKFDSVLAETAACHDADPDIVVYGDAGVLVVRNDTQAVESQATIGNRGIFAQGNHGFHHAAKLFGFGQSSLNDFVLDERVHHVAQHGEAVLAGAIEFT